MYPADDIFAGGLASSSEALKISRRDLQRSRSPSDINIDEELKFGRFLIRRYPFMQSEYLHRSAKLIAGLNTRLFADGAPCAIAPSNVGSSAPISGSSPPFKLLPSWKSLKEFLGVHTDSSNLDTLGLFATSDIQKGNVILKDSTTWGANTLPAMMQLKSRGQVVNSIFRCDNCGGLTPMRQENIYRSKCCNTNYCSNDCMETAKTTYHQVICGKDFSWLKKKSQPAGVKPVPVGINDTTGKLWLRILATCVQSGLHPRKSTCQSINIP